MLARHTAVIRQIIASYTACLLSICYGNSIGWISPIQRFLESDQSPVGKLTEYQIAWIASLPYLGCIVGIFFFAPISGRIGRKTMAYIVAGIYLTSNVVIYFTTSFWLMLAARFALGVCVPGTLSTVTLYISEISNPSIRGNLGSGVLVFCNLGIIIMFFADVLFSYDHYNMVLIAVPIIFMALFWMMPESPVFYLKQNNLEDCKKSLRWLKAVASEEALEAEVDKLRDMFFDLNASADHTALTWGEVFSTKYYRRAFLLGIVLQSSICGSGIIVMQTFSYTILSNFLNGDHPGKYPLYVLLSGLAAGVFSLFIMHCFSRRFTVISTRASCSTFMVLLGVGLVLRDVYNYAIPSYYFVTLFVLYFLFYSMGLGAIVFVVLGELFSVECRDKFMQPLLLLHFTLFSFYVLLYPITVIKIQIYSWFFIYAVNTLALAAILIVYLPETSNRTITEIVHELTKRGEKTQRRKSSAPSIILP